MAIVVFDLENSFFTVGKYRLLQKVGIPMGSPLSPAIAQIVCAFYECRTAQWARASLITNPVVGFRYMDDLTAFIFYYTEKDLWDALKLAFRIRFGYHRNMELEVEDTTKPFKFLSSVLHADAESGLVYSAFHNKNEAAIKAKPHQQFPTYQHYSSFSPATQKISVALSSMLRIGEAVNTTQAAAAAFDLLEAELRGLKYPNRIIKRAFRRARWADARWCGVTATPPGKTSRNKSKLRLLPWAASRVVRGAGAMAGV